MSLSKYHSINNKHISKSCKYSCMSYYSVNNARIKNIKYLKGKDNSSCIYINDSHSESYIAFRGSSNIHDFKDSLTIVPHRETLGFVHKGYYNKYVNIQEAIENVLINDVSEHIIFTGHSMGGCVALLSALKTKDFLNKNNINKNIYCYMFGSPCVGDKDFLINANHELKTVLGIDLDTDVISRIPLNPFFKKPKDLLVLKESNEKNIFQILKNHSCFTYYKEIKNYFDI